MKYTLSCRDVGADCNWAGEADSKEELMAKAAAHAKSVHGYTDVQLKDPKMAEIVKAAIKMK